MGFQRFWEVQFHTRDVPPGPGSNPGRVPQPAAAHGSGLRSSVMWDPVTLHQVRQQRAVPAAFQKLRRSTSSTRTTAATEYSTSALATARHLSAVRALR